MNVCAYVCMELGRRMYVCINVGMCVFMYVCMYVCMYLCMLV